MYIYVVNYRHIFELYQADTQKMSAPSGDKKGGTWRFREGLIDES